MEFISLLLVIVASFIWGYLTGKISGLKEGYRNCMKETLIARTEGRTYVKPYYPEIDNIREKALNHLYGTDEYESEEL